MNIEHNLQKYSNNNNLIRSNMKLNKYGKWYRKRYITLYGETKKRYRQLHTLFKEKNIKLSWIYIFSLIPLTYYEMRKEANDKGVYIAVIVNREVNEIFDEIERRQNGSRKEN